MNSGHSNTNSGSQYSRSQPIVTSHRMTNLPNDVTLTPGSPSVRNATRNRPNLTITPSVTITPASVPSQNKNRNVIMFLYHISFLYETLF